MSTDQSMDAIEHKRNARGPYAISGRLAQTLTLLASGKCKTQLAACAATGLTSRALRNALKRDSVRKFMVQHIQELFSLSSGRAAHKMVELLDAENTMVGLKASAFVLSTGAGIAPPQGPGATVNVGVNVQAAGFVINLSEPEPKVESVRVSSEPVTIDHEPAKPTTTPRPVGIFP